MRKVTLCRLLCALLTATQLCGCLEATQIEVELTTDVNCADRPETTVSVGALATLDSSPPVAASTVCDRATGRIGSLVILPHESKEGHVDIEVVTGLGKRVEDCRRDNFVGGCIVARRSLNFVKHRSLMLPIQLDAACVDVPCGATQTCRQGACVSSTVDPDSCQTARGCMVTDPGAAAGAGGSGGIHSGGSGGTSGNAGQAAGGEGASLSGSGGRTGVADGGQTSTGGGDQTSTGGAQPLDPVLVAADSKSSTGDVTIISPTKAALPEHPGDLLVAWVCIGSQSGAMTPQDNAFWTHYAGGEGISSLLQGAINCEAFTASATGGAESHTFLISPASSATVQRLEFAGSKSALGSPAYAKGLPLLSSPTTSALVVTEPHSALIYFLGVTGSTTLGAIKIGAAALSVPMTQVAATGNSFTSGVAVAIDQPTGNAPAVSYAASVGAWISAGSVVSPRP